MAWVAGSDVSTGDLITAATWNNYLGSGGDIDLLLQLAGGTMSGNIAMGSNKVTGLAAASAAGEAVRHEQLAESAVSDVSGSRADDTVYQNTSGKIMIVIAIFQFAGAGDTNDMTLKIGAANPPTSLVSKIVGDQGNSPEFIFLIGIVPVDYYYAIYTGSGDDPTLIEWLEFSLH